MRDLVRQWLASLRRAREARAHDRRGRRLYRRGEVEAAIDAYREAVRLQPGLAVAHYNLGLALYQRDRKQEARAEWETVRALAAGKDAYLAEQAAILLRQFG